MLSRPALWSFQEQPPASRDSSEDAHVFDLKQAASTRALADKSAELQTGSRARVADKVTRTAAAGMWGGGILWGGMLHEKLQTPRYLGLLCVVKDRYDETPLKLNAQGRQQQPAAGRDSLPLELRANETSHHTKIVQIEHSICCLLQDTQTGGFLRLHGVVPTTLQCVERTTAECLMQSLLRTSASVPDFARLSSSFKHKVRVAVSWCHTGRGARSAGTRQIRVASESTRRCTSPLEIVICAYSLYYAVYILINRFFFVVVCQVCLFCGSLSCLNHHSSIQGCGQAPKQRESRTGPASPGHVLEEAHSVLRDPHRLPMQQAHPRHASG